MLRLALLRHAKSSWDDSGIEDFDRPLNARGRAVAPVMGQMLASLKFLPDIVLCSAAKRTRETLDGIAPSFGTPQPRIQFEDGLYLANPSDIVDKLRDLSASAQSVLVIGHNPGLQTLAMQLARTGDAREIARLNDKFPTAALALFSFDAPSFAQMTSAQLITDGGHLEAFITPIDWV